MSASNTKVFTKVSVCVLLQEDLMRIRIIYNVGYGLSLICLLLAVFIMIFFKWVAS